MKKVFVFGKGEVIVSKCYLNGYVILTKIKPSLGYLGNVKDGDLDGKKEIYSLKLTKKDDKELLIDIKSKLVKMDKSDLLKYDDFILDFTDFNPESIKIVINAIDEALRGCMQLALAC